MTITLQQSAEGPNRRASTIHNRAGIDEIVKDHQRKSIKGKSPKKAFKIVRRSTDDGFTNKVGTDRILSGGDSQNIVEIDDQTAEEDIASIDGNPATEEDEVVVKSQMPSIVQSKTGSA